jgi:hypothetical protein
MKKIAFTLFCMFVLASRSTNAQTRDQMPLPVLQETKKIDSLMDLIIKTDNESKQGINKDSRDTIWIIELIDNRDYISLQIEKKRSEVINYLVNQINTDKEGYGVFQFRGHKILVWAWGNNSFYNLFSKKDESVNLKFVYKLKKNISNPSDQWLHGGFTYHYKYQNNQITTEDGPPPVGKLF